MDHDEERSILRHDILNARDLVIALDREGTQSEEVEDEAEDEWLDDEEEIDEEAEDRKEDDKKDEEENDDEEDNNEEYQEGDEEDGESESGESDETYDASEESSTLSLGEYSRHHSGDSQRLLRNITISRDQTQGSSFDLEKLSAIKETLQRGQTVRFTSFWSDGRALASGGDDHAIRIWDSETGQCVSELQGHSGIILCLAWAATVGRLASGSGDKTVRIWDLKSGNCVSTLRGHRDWVCSISWSPDSSQITSGSNDKSIRIWNSETGECIQVIEGHTDAVEAIAWSPDSSRIASGSSDESIRIWNSETGDCIQVTEGHTHWVEAIAWSPDSSRITSGSNDKSIRIWNSKTGECIQVIEGHTDVVEAIAWSPDSSRIASGSSDQSIRIWNSETGDCIQVIEGHTHCVNAIAWSPDSSHIASSSRDQSIRIWNSSSGECLSTFRHEPPTPVYALVWLASLESENTIQPSDWFQRPITALTASRHLRRQRQLVNKNVTYLDRGDLLSVEFAVSPPLDPSLTSHYSATSISHRLYEGYMTPDSLSPSVTITKESQIVDNSGHSCISSGILASEMATVSWEEMAQRVAQLEEENRKLKANLQTPVIMTWQRQVFHIIKDDPSTYLSVPSWSGDAQDRLTLRGHSAISDPKSYLDRRPDIAFVVCKIYNTEHQNAAVKKARAEASELPPPEPAGEEIRLLSKSMVSAMEAFCKAQPDFSQCFPKMGVQTIPSPYLFWYHYRNNKTVDSLSTESNILMNLLRGWIESSFGALYSTVEEEFSQACVSSSTMPFLVRPGDVLVSKQGRTYEGYIASSWAQKTKKTSDNERSDEMKEISETWTVEVWSYKYDGRFYRYVSSIDIVLKYTAECARVNINTLNAFPLRYADEGVNSLLERRGQAMWNCRVRNLVSYEGDEDDQLYGAGERFMIDYGTYKQLHSDSPGLRKAFPHLRARDRKEMNPEMMDRNEPPPVPERLVFPSCIIGYNLRQKKWLDLKVDRIRNVSWNEDAFEHLVVDDETKVLIRALISSKLEADQGTDVIGGKGNGLIILLHGGPGTGKTFTAESVAEIAKKPLYRVTCGDIGTKPQEVEKYLESVLYLGKIWDCVVLLDEADVFLEQRTLMDLERNALVSVFLRVLEYYEGILILTSNRVGTFDEAFKSRIQLSLHYDALTKAQRSTIWKNFINRLKTLETPAAHKSVHTGNVDNIEPVTLGATTTQQEPSIDYGDIERHIEELAKWNMNGRQIRNVITTGRQLAKHEGQPMSFDHLKRVNRVSSKFDNYLKKLTGNTDEEAAREDRRR